MKLHGEMSINGRKYKPGDQVPGWFVYPFFLVHMGMFGLSGFLIAYAGDGPEVGFLYAHGGIAIFCYVVFYLAIFGREQVGWMFTNAALGLLGIWVEIDWLLSLFGKSASDFAWYVHVVPFTYYVLYTFLLWQGILDLTRSRDDPIRRRFIRMAYVGLTLAVYLTVYFARGG